MLWNVPMKQEISKSQHTHFFFFYSFNIYCAVENIKLIFLYMGSKKKLANNHAILHEPVFLLYPLNNEAWSRKYIIYNVTTCQNIFLELPHMMQIKQKILEFELFEWVHFLLFLNPQTFWSTANQVKISSIIIMTEQQNIRATNF